jgi:NAD(P)-dependent dehydrogenase (short-subunit alcohol dehydrogenase family)
MSLDGKIIIVTGAGGNLGAATLVALARQGALLVAADRSAETLQRSLAATGDPARHLTVAGLDLSVDSGCAELTARALEKFGRIDGLAATVGGFAAAPLADTGTELLLRMVTINAVTTLNILRAVLAPMRQAGSGSVVVVGAAGARHGTSGLGAYAAAKSAALRLVESFADEVRSEGIRVNAVLPGTIDTPPNRAAMPHADPAAWVTPAQIAEIIAFLLSDAATGIAGALIPVTGRGG